MQIISPSDGLPQQLCSNCVRQLHELNEFRKNCFSSVSFLETLLLENIKTSNGTVVELKIEQKTDDSIEEQPESIVLILGENGKLIEERYKSIFENIETLNEEKKIKQELDHDYCSGEAKYSITCSPENTQNDVIATAVPETSEVNPKTSSGSKRKKIFRKQVRNVPNGRHSKDLCTICGALHNHTNMRRHIEIHMGPDRKHPYACTVCDKKFVNRLSFIAHVNRHNDVRPYKCNLCEKSFYGANLLRTHMNSHSTENKYPCSDCDKVFRYPHYLSQHRRIHKANAIYTCNFCDYTNVYLHNYKNHLRKHTGDHKFKCNICEKGFTKRYSLDRHLEKHQQ